jgi:hypothetical protein
MLSQTPAINDRQRSAEVPQHPQFAVPAVPPTCSASFTPFRRTSSSQHRSVAFRHTEVPLFDTPQFLDRLSFQLCQAQ